MPVTRESPLVSVRVFDVGHGTSTALDYGLGWYDALNGSWQHGRSDRTAAGVGKLQYIPDIGLVCRAFVVPKDTRLSHWTHATTLNDVATASTWEEVRPLGGVYRTYRLVQYDTSAGIKGGLASQFSLPANAEVAVSLTLDDSPPDWGTSVEPQVRIAFGGGAWAVRIAKAGTMLERAVGGIWVHADDLPSPARGAGYADLDEIWLYVRPLRGKLAFSFDFGATYHVYALPDGSAISVPAGQVAVATQGGRVGFGLHQLQMVAGTFTSSARDTLKVRGAVTATVTGRYDANGGTVAFTDAGSGPARRAQYAALLTPGTVSAVPFAVYRSPALYAVTYRLPQVLTQYGDDYTTPWDDALLGVDIDKPVELDAAVATLRLHQDAWELFDLEDESLRFRLVQIILGYHLSDETTEEYIAFTGFVRTVDLEWSDEWGATVVTVALDNGSARLKRGSWTPLDLIPFGGMTPNAAANTLLTLRGIDPALAEWHPVGALRALDPGSPEEPFELMRAQELPWETLKRLLGYENLEPVPFDDGTFGSVVKDYVEPEVSWTYRATPESMTDVRELLRRVRHRIDYSESATAVLVYAEGSDGSLLMLGTGDAAAETDLTSARYMLWRDTVVEQVSGGADVGTLAGRLEALARQYLPLKYQGELEAPIHVGLTRRMRIAVYGCAGVGIPDGTEFALMTLHHSARVNEGLTELSTQAGFRRLA